MKLRDLNARFIYGAHAGGSRLSEDETVDKMQGVMFQCPKCAKGKQRGKEGRLGFAIGAHYVRVFFANPRNAPVAPLEADDNPRWTMSGSTIDDLTLSPSVNLDIDHDRNGNFIPVEQRGCRWHGYVKDGDAA